jgi:hypothetical protein
MFGRSRLVFWVILAATLVTVFWQCWECRGILVMGAFAAFWIGGAISWYPGRSHPIAKTLLVVGAVGFFGNAILSFTLASTKNGYLGGIEFPATFTTITIQASDGRFYSATQTTQRIQRYDTQRRFERGWFVNSGSGLMTIGMTDEGNVVLAYARKRQIEIFSPDGVPLGASGPLPHDNKTTASFYDRPLHPRTSGLEGVALATPAQVPNKGVTPTTFILFPLENTVLSWLIMMIGMIPAMIEKWRGRGDGGSPQPPPIPR